MTVKPESAPDPGNVLAKAVIRAGRELALTQTDIGMAIGQNRSTIGRYAKGAPLKPESKEGELAALLVRVYRSLFAVMGGERDGMRHWMRTENRGTQGTPAAQVLTVPGLVRVVEYLDAMRAKV